jgi:uracil-DNA glycosylase family 4
MKERKCTWCRLSATSRGPVWGSGDPHDRLQWWGEAPGEREDKTGVPFIGKAGKESDNYKSRYGIRALPQYTSNTVKCRPPRNRDPKDDEIAACRAHLEEELKCIPDDAVIATLGRFSTAAFLGEHDGMDYIHAIPQRHPNGWIVVPVYHPAVGLYEGRYMTQIDQGYKAVADVLAGRISPEDWRDPYPKPEYNQGALLHEAKVVGVDTEVVRGEIWSVQISSRPGQAGLYLATDPGMGFVKEYLEDPDRLVILHNAQFDLPMLAQLDIHPKKWMDTMLMANILCDVPRGLKHLAYRLCGMKMKSYMDLVGPINDELIIEYLEEVVEVEWSLPDKVCEIKGGVRKWKQPQPLHKRVQRILKDVFAQKCSNPYERWMNQPQEMRDEAEYILGPFHGSTIADVPFDEALYYACRDADATLRIFPKLKSRIDAYDIRDPLILDQGIVRMLAEMEDTGIKVDAQVLRDMAVMLDGLKDTMLREIKDRVGYWVNPSSHDQVRHTLYKKLRVPAPKRKGHDTGPTTNQDHLEKIKSSHPVIPRILAYRAADKLKGSFVDRLLRMEGTDHRVHDDLSQIRTTSGRLTSSIMLLIPKRGDMADDLRKCFVAEDDCYFLSADYSQIELRVLAHMSQDTLMLKTYCEGGDIHMATACNIFGLKPDQVDKVKHRIPAKTVNFGIVYGRTADGLFEQLGALGWSLQDCEKLIRDWFHLYKGVDAFMKNVWHQAKRYGFVQTLCGRRRLIPEVRSVHSWIRSRGLREAGNHPIQGTASDIMKRAMGTLYYEVFPELSKQFYLRPILQLHDDLKVEVSQPHLMTVAREMKFVMEHAAALTVPTPVEMEYGTNWGEMEELEVT